jgi:hypothetical protein
MITPSFITWTAELEDYCEGFQYFRRLYQPLQNKGMACFDINGYMENVWGGDVISIVLEYYLEREWYDRCAVLRDLQNEFAAKYGFIRID